MNPGGLIEGILLAALAVTICANRHRIADYLTGGITMKRLEALSNRALELKRKYRGARAAEDWQEANRLQREYQRTIASIRALSRAEGMEKPR